MDKRQYTIPLVNEDGKTSGYGDRWSTHRVREGADGPILGQKHVGITIACLDDDGRVLLQHRKHRIFDDVWSLSGDTHPRKYDGKRVETLRQAAGRCALEDWGVTVKNWTRTVSVAYSARDPRNPKYCENELLYLMVARNREPVRMNRKNAYGSQLIEVAQIARDSRNDMRNEPMNRKYAPWVHAVFSLPLQKIEAALQ
jgi:isopentenyldiphosphate isomerase